MRREFTISGGNHRYSIRARRQYMPVAIVGGGVTLLIALFNGLSGSLLVGLCILSIIVLFQLVRSNTVLYRVVFADDSKEVQVEIMEADKVAFRHIIPYQKVRVVCRQNFLDRGMPWVLKIYADNVLVCKQEETAGWPYEKLFEIEDAAKVLPV